MYQIPLTRVIRYIEDHLSDDTSLSNAALASVAGYSKFHFQRIFYHTVRLTPADYIRKRRITEIVKHMDDEGIFISNLAYRYGFNSQENFIRAFKREHKILPTECRTVQCSLRLWEPFDFQNSIPMPMVSILYMKAFSLVTYAFDDGYAPNCWNIYNAESRSQRLSGGKTVTDYGAMRWNYDKNKLDYYIGIDSRYAHGDMNGTVTLNVDSGWYAVFQTAPANQYTFVDTVRKTWDWIGKRWLPENDYRRRNDWELECYTESGKTYSETIYIPIAKENGMP